MIDITTEIEEISEDNVEYTLKKYIISSSYKRTTAKILFDGLFNQTKTNKDGVAIISTSNTDEHSIEVTIKDETVYDEL